MLTSVPLGHHLHVGAHDLYPTLVKNVFAEFPEFFEEHLIDLISPQQIRGVLRKADAQQGGLPDLQHLHTRQDCLRAVLSGHGLLCPPEKISSFQGLYGTLADSVGTLARIFSSTSMTVHVVITPQSTYAPVIDFAENFAGPEIWKKPELMSWRPVIRKIQTRFPSSPMVVWAIEDPVEQASEFLCGLTALPFDNAQRERIRQIAAADRFARSRTLPLDGEFEFLLETLYEDDLEAFETMPNVQLGTKGIS